MARGVRKTTEDKMRELGEQIAKEEERLKELKRQYAALAREKQEEDLGELLKAIQESGMTIEEAKEILGERRGGVCVSA